MQPELGLNAGSTTYYQKDLSELLNLSFLAYKIGVRIFISQGHCKDLNKICEMTLLGPGTL